MESQQIKLFTHEQFGKVRVVTIDDDPWFVAADVCRILDLKNPRDAIARFDDDEKQSIILPGGVSKNGVTNTVGAADAINDAPYKGWLENRVNIVNEPGLYRLIFASNKPEAKKFQRWVYHEVLPSIRKTGSYSLAPAPVAKPAPNPNRRAGQLSDACVYVFDLGNGTVKIGQSHDVNRRATDIKRETGLAVIKKYHTPFMTREVARLIEQACKKNFSSRHVKGEIFSVKFDEACAAIDSFVEFAAALTTSKVAVISTKLIAGRKSK